MENAKIRLVNSITNQLIDMYSPEEVNTIQNIILLSLREYDLTNKCTDLVVIDTEAQSMLKKFLATKRVEGKSIKTIERYSYILNRMLDFLNVEIKDIDVFTLRMYLAHLEMNGAKDVTVDGIRSIITCFFNWLTAEGFISVNPAANLGKVKCKKEVKKPFNKVEIEMLKAHCNNLRDRALLEFLIATGCRISEVVNIDIVDVNMIKQECIVLGKGNKERTVFINDVCRLHLQKYLESRNDNYPALFIGRGSDRMTTGGIRRMLKRIEESSGVTNVHPHRFRRTCATSLIDRGMSVQEVATVLGHTNINTTMTYVYSDIANVKNSYSRYTA